MKNRDLDRDFGEISKEEEQGKNGSEQKPRRWPGN